MMQLILTVLIVTLASAGIGLGLLLGRGPAQTSCGASACLPGGGCSTCPMRKAKSADREDTP